MQLSNSFKTLVLVLSALITPSLVWAESQDYEEVSYEELLNELNTKQKNLHKESHSAFDGVRLHAGIGYINSFTNLSTNKKNFSRHANGIQLSIGMDLFSPEWFAEGLFKNYGVTESGSEELSMKDFDLKLGYTNKLEGVWDYSLSAGLSNRFLKFSDPSRGFDVNETSPSFIVSSGFSAQVYRRVSLGAEVSARTAMTNKTADKNSIDFAFRLNTSL